MASASHVAAEDSDSDSETRSPELDRLERAVRALVEERVRLRSENESIREELEAVRGLQERLLAESQLRQDALKRIDDLVGLIEQLDPTLASGSK
jgi:regulator of replication initiation timing